MPRADTPTHQPAAITVALTTRALTATITPRRRNISPLTRPPSSYMPLGAHRTAPERAMGPRCRLGRGYVRDHAPTSERPTMTLLVSGHVCENPLRESVGVHVDHGRDTETFHLGHECSDDVHLEVHLIGTGRPACDDRFHSHRGGGQSRGHECRVEFDTHERVGAGPSKRLIDKLPTAVVQRDGRGQPDAIAIWLVENDDAAGPHVNRDRRATLRSGRVGTSARSGRRRRRMGRRNACRRDHLRKSSRS